MQISRLRWKIVGDLVFEETMPNDAQTALTLPESAVPGTWTLSVSALGIKRKNNHRHRAGKRGDHCRKCHPHDIQ